MAYKTILTVVTDTDLKSSALDAAITLARREDAHLEIVCLGVDRTQTGYYYVGASAVIMQETLQKAQEDAEAIEGAVQTRMANEDCVWSSEAMVAQITGITQLIAGRARFADLVVLPRPYGAARGLEDEAVIEAALFDAHAPVLVVPDSGAFTGFGTRPILAWNQTAEALAAIRASLSALSNAPSVNIAIIDPPQHGPDRSDPGGMLSQMLGRHGVRAEISVLAKTMPRVSDVLMRHVQDINADMIVMGAYSHSRFREALMGGATRDMLENTTVPILMAH
ncbi:MAG: universal stress protein [Rhodovulum sp.]|nr:universal stress protein [Rhodovulum sp.]